LTLAAGVTRAFIMNGLQHAARLLAAAADGGGDSRGSAPAALTPQHFEYWCLYSEELGRHEAHYRALQDTVVRLPACVSRPLLDGARMQHTGHASAMVEAARDGSDADRGGSTSVAIERGECVRI
jgi:uncharacterized SAM-dependent methyltransferase